jgi:hypothetical protein
MKKLKSTLLAVALIVVVSSTAFAGNIGGLRTSGNIGGLRTTGNIGGTRSAGNIGGMRTAGGTAPSIAPSSRFDLDFSGMFTALIRSLLESGALL